MSYLLKLRKQIQRDREDAEKFREMMRTEHPLQSEAWEQQWNDWAESEKNEQSKTNQ